MVGTLISAAMKSSFRYLSDLQGRSQQLDVIVDVTVSTLGGRAHTQHMHALAHTHTRARARTHTHGCTHAHIRARAHTHMHGCTHLHARAPSHACPPFGRRNRPIHARTHARTHARMHAHALTMLVQYTARAHGAEGSDRVMLESSLSTRNPLACVFSCSGSAEVALA